MKKTIVLGQYKGYLSDLRRTLFIRFGVSAKADQLIKHLNGDVVIKDVGMTDDQEQKIKAWRDETIGSMEVLEFIEKVKNPVSKEAGDEMSTMHE